MGSPNQTDSADSFGDARVRISRAFEHLREEMKEIQRQDIYLLKQLMHIRHTILILSRNGERRSCSISALDPSAQDIVCRSEMTSPFRKRPSLTRVQSAPLESCVSEETIMEEEEEDELAQSFNSTASESKIVNREQNDLSNRLGRPSPDTDFIYALGPLPPVFKRLMTSLSPETSLLPNHACAAEQASATSGQEPTHAHSLSQQVSSLRTPTQDVIAADKSLLKLVAKRQLLRRQRSVEEDDALGNAVIENLQKTKAGSSLQVGIQV